MAHYWWKDLLDRDNTWQGLELMIQSGPHSGQALEMFSGHHGRMSLQVNGEPLFWASMLKNHSGIWLVFNSDHPKQNGMLPPITSVDVEAAKKNQQQEWIAGWCRYFSQQLMDSPSPLLPTHRWLLRPMFPVKLAAPYACNSPLPVEQWRFESPASTIYIGCRWSLYGEDFHDLTTPEQVTLVDWWWGGNLLLGRYAIQPDDGRLKWWRKKCREGSLPPVLVWYIAGLASFVILDGHYRLQAAIKEGIPPDFLVLSELTEQVYQPDPKNQERILKALALQQQNNPDCNIDGVNQTLINLYDIRHLYASTHSRAMLGNGDSWAEEVGEYLRKYQLDGYLERIINRVIEV